MLSPGRPAFDAAEDAALDELLVTHGEQASVTRRDPNESGPLIVEFPDGKQFLIDGAEVSELG